MWQGGNDPAAQDLPLWCQWGTWCQPECNSGRQEPGWRGRKALAQVRGVKETGNARGNRWSGRKGTEGGKWLTSTDAEQEWGDPRRVEVNLPETRGVFLMWRGGIPGPKGNGSQSISHQFSFGNGWETDRRTRKQHCHWTWCLQRLGDDCTGSLVFYNFEMLCPPDLSVYSLLLSHIINLMDLSNSLIEAGIDCLVLFSHSPCWDVLCFLAGAFAHHGCKSVNGGKCEFQQWRRMVWFKVLGLYQGNQAKITKGEFRMTANKSYYLRLFGSPLGRQQEPLSWDSTQHKGVQKAQACTGRQMGLVGPLCL